MSEEIEEIEGEGIDLEELAKRYETRGFFSRMCSMFAGLGKPKSSREYKLARIEMQRLMAPLIAIVSVFMLVGSLIVFTMVSENKAKTLEITVAKVEQDEVVPEEMPDEEPPDDPPEPPPMEDVEIMVDTPTPGPVSPMSPVAPPTTQQVSVKPAAQDTVAIINSPVKMKSMVGSRTPGSIGMMTRGGAGYGDEHTEATVLKVLWWLKEKQEPDGSWGGGSSRLANTSLAVLTYLAHGEYPGAPSPYRKDFGVVVEKALNWIIAQLYTGKDGKVHMKGSDEHEYAFLIATYALNEAYGMTKNPNCKTVAMQTMERIIQGQSATGGWDYYINPDSTRDDLSFAGWALQALKAGKMAGLHPKGLDECIAKAIKCLQTRSFYKDHFTYCAASRNHPGLTGTGCLAMQLLGYGDKPEVKTALNYMREWKPSFKSEEMGVNPKDCPSPQYYSYYVTQCKFQAGMRKNAAKADQVAWEKWNAEMKRLYIPAIKNVPAKVKDHTGKEHHQGYFENSDVWSSRPVMDTCLVALQLMVYYRYLPTTQAKAGEVADVEAGAAATESNDVDVTVDI